MRKSAGSFNPVAILLGLLILLTAGPRAYAQNEAPASWKEFSRAMELKKAEDERNGLSYVISGSIALGAGLIGASASKDEAEKGIYTLFQTIGIGSIGYGAYTWQLGDEERSIYETLRISKLSAVQKTEFLESYRRQSKDRLRQERLIKAITHGLIAGMNFYSATQQKEESLQNALYFVGTVNLLATFSFTF